MLCDEVDLYLATISGSAPNAIATWSVAHYTYCHATSATHTPNSICQRKSTEAS